MAGYRLGAVTVHFAGEEHSGYRVALPQLPKIGEPRQGIFAKVNIIPNLSAVAQQKIEIWLPLHYD
jgi:hypothetical protein